MQQYLCVGASNLQFGQTFHENRGTAIGTRGYDGGRRNCVVQLSTYGNDDCCNIVDLLWPVPDRLEQSLYISSVNSMRSENQKTNLFIMCEKMS